MALVAAVSVAAAAGWQGGAQPPQAKAAADSPRIVWLNQNWGEPLRARFHHESQGTATLPFPRPWILALEQRDGSGMFTDADYLERFGFIPSPRAQGTDPVGLPIGFARTSGIDPAKNVPFDSIGFTCAACHTARIDHNDTSILVDGGPALINLADFGTDLALTLASTLKLDRFGRFANRVLGPQATKRERRQLYERVLASLLRQGASQVKGKFRAVFSHDPKSVEEGFGRLDALNRIGNTVFGQIDSSNVRPQTAPVAYPHIWDTHWFQWVQYNGSIEQPMVRNAGEAMGVGAIVNYTGTATPRLTSTIPFRELDEWVEQPLRGREQPQQNRRFTGLTSPAWPSEILLSPTRPNSFHLGTHEYDPVNVGYADGGGFELFSFRRKDANSPLRPVPGNLNTGHWFDNDRSRPGVIGRLLSERERRALIEYLKTL